MGGGAFRDFWSNLDTSKLGHELKRILEKIRNFYNKTNEEWEEGLPIEENPFRLLEISECLFEVALNYPREGQDGVAVKGRCVRLIRTFFVLNWSKDPFVQFKLQQFLMELWKADVSRVEIEFSFGEVVTDWLHIVNKNVNENDLQGLAELISEAPWRLTADPVEQHRFWYPMRWVVDTIVATEQSAPLFQLLDKGQPEGNQHTFFFELKEKVKHVSEQNTAPQTAESGNEKSKIVTEAIRQRFRFQVEAKDYWETNIEEQIYQFMQPILEPQTDDLLMETVEKFLSPNGPRVLLFLGDPGSGKSVIARNIAYELATQTNSGFTPVFISLGASKDPQRACLKKPMMEVAKSTEEYEEWQKDRPFLFICDGFDEMKQPYMLYHDNNMDAWKQSKFIFTCRTYVKGFTDDISRFFTPRKFIGREDGSRNIDILNILPFSVPLRNSFLEFYIEKEYGKETEEKRKELLQEYIYKIDRYKLKELSLNPFILRALAEVLLELEDKQEKGEITHINRSAIYRAFTQERLEKDEERANTLGYAFADVDTLRHYSEGLAMYMLKCEDYVLDLNPDPKFPDQYPVSGLDAIGYLMPKTEELKAFGTLASMITSVGKKRYSFMHHSIFEFFVSTAVARGIMELVKKESFTAKDVTKKRNQLWLTCKKARHLDLFRRNVETRPFKDGFHN